jgi:3-phosphoshikimate 1-carboxyvinyltransferase
VAGEEIHSNAVIPVVHVPGSKSLTQRALIAAALAADESLIVKALIAEDTKYLIDGLLALGARIEPRDEGLFVCGTAGKILPGAREIFLGNNGTALRFLTVLVSLGQGQYVLTGERRLCERPVGALTDALKNMGVDVSCQSNCPPVVVNARGLRGGKITLQDVDSSQFVSALLLCAPYTELGMELTLQGRVVSAPYIDLTIAVMRDFGIQAASQEGHRYSVAAGGIYGGRKYVVEGDASSASYFFLAAALLQKTVRVQGISRQSKQGDIRLLDVMEKLGCLVQDGADWVEVSGNNPDSGDFTFDLNDMPDMVPTLAVLAAFRPGTTTITNVAHLRFKESDRLVALATEIKRMGIDVHQTGDGLVIEGGKPKPAAIETYNDHRLAMSFAVAGLAVRGIEIRDRRCVDKSFPGFWEELKKI